MSANKLRKLEGSVSSNSSASTASKTHNTFYAEPCFKLVGVSVLSPSENVGSITLSSILSSGDLEEMVQINYMVDIEYLINQLPQSKRHSLRTTIVHGLRDESAKNIRTVALLYRNIKVVPVSMPITYGTHHTKAMLLFFTDGTMRVVIHTANIIEREWCNKSQGVYMTPILPRKRNDSSSCEFETDLINYFKSYSNNTMREYGERLKNYDFSSVKAVLIASVPGYHTKDSLLKWGHMRLRTVLGNRVTIPSSCQNDSTVICQFSSIGSLGTKESWLKDEFFYSLSCSKNEKQSRDPDLKLIFPTVENVRDSLEGWSAGESLPFTHANYTKQKNYMIKYLCKWKAFDNGRERAMPHIKTYTRLRANSPSELSHESNAEVAWFLLTSSNLSKAAWGSLQKKGIQLMIRNYELGVLFYPELFQMDESIPVHLLNATLKNLKPSLPSFIVSESSTNSSKKRKRIDEESCQIVPIRIPYDLPLTLYDSKKDDCWTWDIPRKEIDWLGRSYLS
ncbi:18929_t:CDS:10 [Acaulospora morrowiae]|uniref:18929_t:CDS:1 n=1 Tax=Acaulospora morrowiae TaxID=94023 RepID=A0A9N9G729_9GLOM|nr:18929_t:CDS:10 [Acaulospora morrowiae]